LTIVPSKTPSLSPPPTKTLTEVVDPCDGISLGGLAISGDEDKFSLMITNSRPEPIIITEMIVHWPPEHEKLTRVKLDGITIWDFGDEDSPTTMPPWGSLTMDREIKEYQSKKLEFYFDEEAEDVFVNDYSLVITFDTGCTLSP
jgi:hypothetical protein